MARLSTPVAAQEKPPAIGAPSYRFDPQPVTLDDLRNPQPPLRFAIKPLLPRGCLAEMSGAHGISKSTMALGMCLSVAASYDWAGLPTDHGPAVFLSREDPRPELLRRVQAWLAAFSPEDRIRCEHAFTQWLRLVGRDECQSLRLTTKEYGTCRIRYDLVDRLVEYCRGAVLIVLETASRLSGGDELNEDLSVLAEALELLAAESGAAVLLVRHVGKVAAREKSIDSYSGRGGGALSDAARSVLVLTEVDSEAALQHGITIREGDSIVMLVHAKGSYSEKAPPLFFRRRPGPVLERVASKTRDQVHEESLLAWLLGHGRASTRKLEEAIKHHGVPARAIRPTLDRLARKGSVLAEKVSGRGGLHLEWSATTETD